MLPSRVTQLPEIRKMSTVVVQLTGTSLIRLSDAKQASCGRMQLNIYFEAAPTLIRLSDYILEIH